MSPPVLALRGLCFAWPTPPGAPPAPRLGPLDLDRGPGLHLLTGPNGAGKSTLLQLCAGLLAPTAGTVRVCGGDPAAAATRRQLAFLPTTDDLPGFLCPGELCAELLALRGPVPRAAARAESDQRLAALGVPRRRRLDQLSAGQRRKAALVAALAATPPVLLLDEPLANLDAESVAVVAGWLAGLRRTHLILLTGHGLPGLAADSELALDRSAG